MSTTDNKKTTYINCDYHILLKLLRVSIIRIVFTKRDGTERVMLATRSTLYDPKYVKKTDKIRKKEYPLISVIDTEKGEWRTVNMETIKSADFLQVVGTERKNVDN